jgi:Flp pilus assembly protein TadG
VKHTAFSACGRSAQRGVAALEFAAMATVFFLLIYGIATFGAAFYTQQVLTRAAEDGARASSVVTGLQANDTRIRSVVLESLASSAIVPATSAGSRSLRLAWLQSNLTSLTIDTSNVSQVAVRVVYSYRANPILAPIPLTQSWFPASLTGRATAARATP